MMRAIGKISLRHAQGRILWRHLWTMSLLPSEKPGLLLNPSSAFRSIALTFSAPALVPHDMIGALDADTRLKLLDEAVRLEDHFSLIGAFELCAAWVEHDPSFVAVGERLLDALFKNMKRLEIACGMFGAALVLAVARIAEHETLKGEPAYWRRLSAASHALLVVRSCGVTEIDHNDLLKWAIGQSGESYFLSILSDFKTDPQWRPEWVDPRFLVADVSGRAIGAFDKIPQDKAPESWKPRIDGVRAWLSENHCELLARLPAVMEGARRQKRPVLAELGFLIEPYERLIKESFRGCIAAAYASNSRFWLPK